MRWPVLEGLHDRGDLCSEGMGDSQLRGMLRPGSLHVPIGSVSIISICSCRIVLTCSLIRMTSSPSRVILIRIDNRGLYFVSGIIHGFTRFL